MQAIDGMDEIERMVSYVAVSSVINSVFAGLETMRGNPEIMRIYYRLMAEQSKYLPPSNDREIIIAKYQMMAENY